MNLPHEYHYKFSIFYNLLEWKLDWKNIEYGKVDLNIHDVELKLKEVENLRLVSIKFPALKHWNVKAH